MATGQLTTTTRQVLARDADKLDELKRHLAAAIAEAESVSVELAPAGRRKLASLLRQAEKLSAGLDQFSAWHKGMW